MVDIETMERHDKAIYWAASGKNRYGKITVASPIDLDVRWEYVNREIVGPQGEVVRVDAVVVVDRVILDGSIMWKGSLKDIPGTSETPTSNIMTVIGFGEIPGIKGRKVRRVVYLQRYSDNMPEVI